MSLLPLNRVSIVLLSSKYTLRTTRLVLFAMVFWVVSCDYPCGDFPGGTNSITNLADFWEYDPSVSDSLDERGDPMGGWTKKADLGLYGRSRAFTFTIGDYGYVGGGVGASATFTDFWKYNPQFNDWTAVNTIPDGLVRSEAVSVATSKYGFVDSGGNGYYVYGEEQFWMFIPEE